MNNKKKSKKSKEKIHWPRSSSPRFAALLETFSCFSRRRHSIKVKVSIERRSKNKKTDVKRGKAACKNIEKKNHSIDGIEIQSHLSDLRHAVRLEHILDLSLHVAEAEGLRGRRGRRGFPESADAPRARVARRGRRRDHMFFFFQTRE